MRPVFVGGLATAACALAPAVLAGSVESTAASFLDIDVSPRSVALAASASASRGDLASSQWNPAGLSDVRSPRVGLMHGAWFEGLSLEWLGYGIDVGDRGGAAVALTFLRSDAIARFDAFGEPDGEFHVYDAALSAGYGHRFGDRLALGVTARGIRQSVDGRGASGFAADVGLSTRAGSTSLSAVARNLGPDVDFDGDAAPLPTTYVVAAAQPLLGERVVLTGAANLPVHYHDDLRVGAEWMATRQVALRAGYRYVLEAGTDDQLTGPTFGVGFGMSGIRLDYAYQPFEDLGDTHHIALTIALNRSAATPRPAGRDALVDTAPELPEDREPVAAPRARRSPAPDAPAAVAPPASKTPETTASATRVEAAAPASRTYAVAAGIHGSRLSALLELRALRVKGLEGGTIRRLEDGRYRVLMKEFDSREKAARWVSEHRASFGFKTLEIVALD